VKSVVASFAVELHAEPKEDLAEDVILSKVKKAGGADYSGNTSTA
jgi:hypothetical protein